MSNPLTRKPFALANWKMAMTLSQSLTFVQSLCATLADTAQVVDIVICPPYTALHAVAEALAGTPIALGAQNLHAAAGLAHTGEISAALLADVGCEWVMLNHWEIRRRTGETDADVNRKALAALQAGLRPILLIGEQTSRRGQAQESLAARLPSLFAGCETEHVARMVIVYEPEWTIGIEEPAPPEYVARGCGFIRQWIGQEYGASCADAIRIIYGGSVAPEYTSSLLASPDVDGAGASRKGRDPDAFAEIVHLIVSAKELA
jgi:triosephosphate isomerase